jgi:hypothetical protein
MSLARKEEILKMNGDTGARHRREVGLRGLPAVAALALVALLTAACGGGSHPAGSGAGNPVNLAEALESWVHCLHGHARCMRTHGYPNWPDPSASRTGPMGGVVNGNDIPPNIDTSAPQFRSAAKACGEAVPPGG